MYDIGIIGAGPAGLTAALYTVMYGLSTITIGDEVGGKLRRAPDIIDYPGFETTTGAQVIAALTAQISREGITVQQAVVSSVVKDAAEKQFSIKADTNKTYQAKTVLFATGNGNKQPQHRGAPLAQQLGIELDNGFFTVNEHYMTAVAGIFAAGDCIRYPKSLEQIVTAVGTAAAAAAGVYKFVKGAPPPILWGTSRLPRR